MINKDEDMSNTFIAEVGQKSAIAKEEVIESLNEVEPVVPQTNEVNTESNSNFPEVDTSLPNESQTVNVDTPPPVIPKDEYIPGYENQNTYYNDEQKTKKSNPFIIILLMILSLAVGIGGSYYYFEVLKGDIKKEEASSSKLEVNDKTEKKEVELLPDSLYVKELIENYDFQTTSSIDIYNMLYSKEKIAVKELDETYLRALAAIKANKNLTSASFTSQDFQEAAVMLFGNQVTLQDKTIYDGKICINIKYNDTNKIYTLGETACGGTSSLELERKIVKAVENDSKLTVNIAVAVKDSATNKVYKGYNANSTDPNNTFIDELEGVSAETFNIDDNYSNLNQYKYTFNYDEENNNYYLETIELIK